MKKENDNLSNCYYILASFRLGENANAFRGGFRLWEETGERRVAVPQAVSGN